MRLFAALKLWRGVHVLIVLFLIQRCYIAPNAQARGSKLQGAVLETVSGVNDEQRNSDFQFLE